MFLEKLLCFLIIEDKGHRIVDHMISRAVLDDEGPPSLTSSDDACTSLHADVGGVAPLCGSRNRGRDINFVSLRAWSLRFENVARHFLFEHRRIWPVDHWHELNVVVDTYRARSRSSSRRNRRADDRSAKARVLCVLYNLSTKFQYRGGK